MTRPRMLTSDSNSASAPAPMLAPVLAALDELTGDAARFRAYGLSEQAALLERAVATMRQAIAETDAAPLTIEEAAAESGFSRDHLRHRLADGTLPNVGKRGAPRVRRGDLPRKPAKPAPRPFDVDADALRIHARLTRSETR